MPTNVPPKSNAEAAAAHQASETGRQENSGSLNAVGSTQGGSRTQAQGRARPEQGGGYGSQTYQDPCACAKAFEPGKALDDGRQESPGNYVADTLKEVGQAQ